MRAVKKSTKSPEIKIRIMYFRRFFFFLILGVKEKQMIGTNWYY
jgi:hypothetical protein